MSAETIAISLMILLACGAAITYWREIAALIILVVALVAGLSAGWAYGVITFFVGVLFLGFLVEDRKKPFTQRFVQSNDWPNSTKHFSASPSITGFCYCYVIGDGFCHKVGIAYRPSERLMQLQTGHPNRLLLMSTYRCADRNSAYELEQAVHRELDSYRVGGEWFNLRFDIVDACVRKNLPKGAIFSGVNTL